MDITIYTLTHIYPIKIGVFKLCDKQGHQKL